MASLIGRQAVKQYVRQKGWRKEGQIYRTTDVQTYVYRHMDIQTDRHTDGQTERLKGRQKDIHTM